MRVTGPLFRFDAGWLFVAAGLAACAAGVVLPAQGDLRSLQQQLQTLRAEEARAYARLKAYNDFLDQLDEEDPALVRRLAASQLNIVPANDRPVLLSTAQIAPVTNWIEATVPFEPSNVRLPAESTLSRLASGPSRLWLFAGGIMCVFIGLLMGPGTVRKAGSLFSFIRGEDDEVETEIASENHAATAVLETPAVEQLKAPPLQTESNADAIVETITSEIDAELDQSEPAIQSDGNQVILEVELEDSEAETDADDAEGDEQDQDLLAEAVEDDDEASDEDVDESDFDDDEQRC